MDNNKIEDNWQELAKQKIDHWEPVITMSNKQECKVWIYYREGKTFAKQPVYEEEKPMHNAELIARIDTDAGDILEECPAKDIAEVIRCNYVSSKNDEKWDRIYEWLFRVEQWQLDLLAQSLKQVKEKNTATNLLLRREES